MSLPDITCLKNLASLIDDRQNYTVERATVVNMLSMFPFSLPQRLPGVLALRKRRRLSMRVSQKSGAIEVEGSEQCEAFGSQGIADHKSRVRFVKDTCPEAKIVKFDSGVDHKWGRTGLQLISNALEGQEPDPRFARQAFVDGVGYALRALPRDLSDEEIQHIHRSIPEKVAVSAGYAGPNALALPPPEREQRANIIHRSVRHLIVKLFILAKVVYPLVLWLMSEVVRLNKEYAVLETFGRRLSCLLVIVWNSSLGKAASSVATWILVGVVGGMTDGIGEGLDQAYWERQ